MEHLKRPCCFRRSTPPHCYAFGLLNVAVAAIVLAMGLENAVFQIDGGAGLGLTYVNW